MAVLSLGWNIYRDTRLKGKIIVTVDKVKILIPGSTANQNGTSMIQIRAINHGPGKVTITGIFLRRNSWKKEDWKYAYLVINYTDTYTSKLPTILDIGETANYLFVYQEDCFLKNDYDQVGVKDSFGRNIWATKKSFKKLREDWLSEFKKPTK